MCRCFIACINGCFIVGDGSLCPSRRGLLGLLAQTSKSPPAVSSLSMCRQKKLQLLVCANFIFSKKGQKTAPFCVVRRKVGKRNFNNLFVQMFHCLHKRVFHCRGWVSLPLSARPAWLACANQQIPSAQNCCYKNYIINKEKENQKCNCLYSF